VFLVIDFEQGHPMSYHDLHAAEVSELLEQDGLVVIDTRDPQTQSKGQLPHAQPASDALISALLRQRRNDPAVLVYCYHGNQSRDLCGFLSQLGLSRVYNLVGGWEAWQNWRQQATPGLDTTHTAWLESRGFDPANLNSRVELGMSALMQAALEGEQALVEALLAAGADPNAVNDDMHHALWFACVHGDPGLVQRLIKAGGKLDNRNINGVTCAIYAASTGKLEVLRTLIEAGADLGIQTHDGVDVLDSAATLPVLRYLKPLIRRAG